MIRLDCPLCGAVVWDAPDEPDATCCPGCGARVLGPADDARAAVTHAAESLGVDSGVDLARALFAIGPGHPLDGRVAITSDRRDGFYRWWVVVGGEDPAGTLRSALP